MRGGALVALALAALAAAQKITYPAPEVTSVSPRIGSVSGGTMLTIRGTAFGDGYDRIPTVSIGGIPCEVEPFMSSDKQIMCRPGAWTGWSDSGDQPLVVSVDGLQSACRGGPCTFRWHPDFSPDFRWIAPDFGDAGANVQVRSRIWSTDPTQVNVKLGERTCKFVGLDDNEDIEVESSGWSTYTCSKDPLQPAGYYNVSVNVRGSRGDAWIHRDSWRVGPADQRYHHFIRPIITSVEPATGSLAGGTEVTIRGSGFARLVETMTVHVGGARCDVRAASETELVCVARPAPDAILAAEAAEAAATEAAGGVPPPPSNTSVDGLFLASEAGLRFQRYNNIGSSAVAPLLASPRFPALADSEEVRAFWSSPENIGDNYGSRATAILTPRASGWYAFEIRGDDETRVLLGPAMDLEGPFALNRSELRVVGSNVAPYNGVGDSVWLDGRRAYWVEVLHKEGGGADYSRLGLRFYSTRLNAKDAAAAVDDVQRVTAEVSVATEQHTLVLPTTNQVNGTLMGQFAINVTTSYQPAPLASASPTDPLPPRISVTKQSRPLWANASTADVQSALTDLFSVPCEYEYFGAASTIRFYDRDNFEGGPGSADDWSARNVVDPVVQQRPFCGRYGLHMWQSWGRNFELGSGNEPGQDSNGYLVHQFPWMCMAWRIPPTTRANMLVWTNVTGWRSIRMTQAYNRPSYPAIADWGIGARANGEWNYDCINVQQQVEAIVGQRPVRVGAIIFHDAGSDIEPVSGPFQIDEFAIATHPVGIRPAALDRDFRRGFGGDGDFDPSSVRVDSVTPPASLLPLSDPRGATTAAASLAARAFRLTVEGHDCNSDSNMTFALHSLSLQIQSTPAGNTTTVTRTAVPSSALAAAPTQVASLPRAGRFRISFNGSAWAYVSHSANEQQFKDALVGLGTAGSNLNVWMSYGCASSTWFVQFLDRPGRQPMLEVDGSELRGTDAAVRVASHTAGATRWEAIPRDFLRVPVPLARGAATVEIDRIVSSCNPSSANPASSCRFSFAPDRTPVITGLAPTAGRAGELLTISGRRFSLAQGDASRVEVAIGALACDVEAVNDVNITCRLAAEFADARLVADGRGIGITVRIRGVGLALVDAAARVAFSFDAAATSVSPAAVSIGGDAVVTVAGHGLRGAADEDDLRALDFAQGLRAEVHFASGGPAQPVEILRANYHLVELRLPPLPLAERAALAAGNASSVSATLWVAVARSGTGAGEWEESSSGSGGGGGTSSRRLDGSVRLRRVATRRPARHLTEVAVSEASISVAYALSATPRITGLSPALATGSGNVLVTLSGSNLASAGDSTLPTVDFVGATATSARTAFPCRVTQATDTMIQCRTAPSAGAADRLVPRVRVAPQGAALPASLDEADLPFLEAPLKVTRVLGPLARFTSATTEDDVLTAASRTTARAVSVAGGGRLRLEGAGFPVASPSDLVVRVRPRAPRRGQAGWVADADADADADTNNAQPWVSATVERVTATTVDLTLPSLMGTLPFRSTLFRASPDPFADSSSLGAIASWSFDDADSVIQALADNTGQMFVAFSRGAAGTQGNGWAPIVPSASDAFPGLLADVTGLVPTTGGAGRENRAAQFIARRLDAGQPTAPTNAILPRRAFLRVPHRVALNPIRSTPFTVAATVRLDALPPANKGMSVVATLFGTRNTGFALGVDPCGRWVFALGFTNTSASPSANEPSTAEVLARRVTPIDAATVCQQWTAEEYAAWTRASLGRSTVVGPTATVGAWTSLAGRFDPARDEQSLWINGELVATIALDASEVASNERCRPAGTGQATTVGGAVPVDVDDCSFRVGVVPDLAPLNDTTFAATVTVDEAALFPVALDADALGDLAGLLRPLPLDLEVRVRDTVVPCNLAESASVCSLATASLSFDATPTLTGLANVAGNASANVRFADDDILVVRGSLLAAEPDNEGSSVLVGNVPCEPLLLATATELRCRLGANTPVGSAAVVVTTHRRGRALPWGRSVGSARIEVRPRLTQVTPATLAVEGGAIVDVRGSGLRVNATTVTLPGSAPCTPLANDESGAEGAYVASPSWFRCVAGPRPTSAAPGVPLEGPVVVTVLPTTSATNALEALHACGPERNGPCRVAFDDQATARVVSVSPLSGAAIGTEIVITGTGFARGNGSEVNGVEAITVWLLENPALAGARSLTCPVTSVTDTEIRCVTEAGGVGVVGLRVATPLGFASFVPETGSATAQSARGFGAWGALPTFSFDVSITAVSGRKGPLAGGSTLVLEGSGFAGGAGDVVRIGDQPCVLSAATSTPTHLECTVPAFPRRRYTFENFASAGLSVATAGFTAVRIGATGTANWEWFGGGLRHTADVFTTGDNRCGLVAQRGSVLLLPRGAGDERVWSDYALSARVWLSGRGTAGLVLGYQNASTFLQYTLDPTSNCHTLWHVSNGRWTALANRTAGGAETAPGVWHDVTAVLQDARVTVLVDGFLALDVDRTRGGTLMFPRELTKGVAGLVTWSAVDARFDDVVVDFLGVDTPRPVTVLALNASADPAAVAAAEELTPASSLPLRGVLPITYRYRDGPVVSALASTPNASLTFEYDEATSPLLRSVEPTEVRTDNTLLRVRGARLQPASGGSASVVFVHDVSGAEVPCGPVTWNVAQEALECRSPSSLRGGSYAVVVTVNGVRAAAKPVVRNNRLPEVPSIRVVPSVSAVVPEDLGTVAGGAVVTLSGRALPAQSVNEDATSANDVAITVCGVPCRLLSVASGEVDAATAAADDGAALRCEVRGSLSLDRPPETVHEATFALVASNPVSSSRASAQNADVSADGYEKLSQAGRIHLQDATLELGVDALTFVRFSTSTVSASSAPGSIPRGAEIQEAWIEFVASTVSGADNDVVLGVSAARQPAVVSALPNAVSQLVNTSRTDAEALWPLSRWVGVGGRYRTPNLASVLQELVDAPSWPQSPFRADEGVALGDRVTPDVLFFLRPLPNSGGSDLVAPEPEDDGDLNVDWDDEMFPSFADSNATASPAPTAPPASAVRRAYAGDANVDLDGDGLRGDAVAPRLVVRYAMPSLASARDAMLPQGAETACPVEIRSVASIESALAVPKTVPATATAASIGACAELGDTEFATQAWVTASNEWPEFSTYYAARAVDGNTNTYWLTASRSQHAAPTTAQFTLDLLRPVVVRSVSIHWFLVPTRWRLLASLDGLAWTEVHAQSAAVLNPGVYRPRTADGSGAVVAWFVRVQLDESAEATHFRFGIREIGVRGCASVVPAAIVSASTADPARARALRAAARALQPNAPTLTNLSPRRGSTAGGTEVTLTGTNFGTDSSRVTVTIASAACAVISVSDTTIRCRTGVPAASRMGRWESVRVNVRSRGNAVPVGLQQYMYVDLWSRASTWGGGPLPVEGDSVAILEGQTVLLDVSPPKLNVIIVQGKLIFDDSQDLELNAHAIMVNGANALFQVGTASAPFQHNAVIRLHGHVKQLELPVYGTKMLAVRYGTLDLHGKWIHRPWTRLAQTAPAGSATITVKVPVDWNVGDLIVIASTGHSPEEAEPRTITAISADRMTLTLNQTLAYEHLSRVFSYAADDENPSNWGSATRTVAIEGEVALLTRNVRFEGAPDSDYPNEFGAHLMLHSKGDESLTGRLSNVEFSRVGQAYRLGRYALHFHMIGNVRNSYIRRVTVRNSFNRAFTVHGVYNLEISDNVAYDIMGHTFFIEDAIETDNRLINNLAIYTRSSRALLNTDMAPASFWITNPDNVFEGNVAAGGSHYGFWFKGESAVSGVAAAEGMGTNVCPRNTRLGSFRNNTAHSNGRYGLRIYEFLAARQNPCDPSSRYVTSEFRNMTSYRNGKNGVTVTAQAHLIFREFAVFENLLAGFEMASAQGGFIDGEWGNNNIQNSLIVGSQLWRPSELTVGIMGPGAHGLLVDRVTFANFNHSNTWALRACAKCERFTPLGGGWETRFRDIGFTNSPNRVYWRWKHEAVYHDLDGSLGRTGGRAALVPNNGLLGEFASCVDKAGYGGNYGGKVCSNMLFRRLSLNGHMPESLMYKDVVLKFGSSSDNVVWHFKRRTKPSGYDMTLPVNLVTPVELSWAQLPSQRVDIDRFNFDVGEMLNGESLLMKVDYIQEPAYFQIHTVDTPLSRMVARSDPMGSYFWDDVTRMLFFNIRRIESGNSRSVIDTSYRSFRCPKTGCPVESPCQANRTVARRTDWLLWSDPATWTLLGAERKPVDGDNVTIPWEFNVELDENSPILDNLWIQGRFRFQDQASTSSELVLTASRILVRHEGRFSVGARGVPFVGRARIRLVGDRFTDDYGIGQTIVPPKTLASLGELVLVGADRGVSWTKVVGDGIEAGETSLTVRGLVRWRAGDEVVITTTSFEPAQAEKRVLASVTANAAQDTTTLVFTVPVTFNHLVVTATYGSRTVTTAPEVGLLTKSIVIEGSDADATGVTNRGVPYAATETDQFGCRVMITREPADECVAFQGGALLSHVELHRCGHGSFGIADGRGASLLINNVGRVPAPPSALSFEVSNSAFDWLYHNGPVLNGNVNGIVLRNNVVFRSVDSAFSIYGNNHTVEDNLAAWVVFDGTHNGANEAMNMRIPAGFVMAGSPLTILRRNVVGGSERVGFRVDPAVCGAVAADGLPRMWENEAHGTGHGVWMNEAAGGDCVELRGFTTWFSWENGLVNWSPVSIRIADYVSVNNKIGLNVNVMGPPATMHLKADKYVLVRDSLFVGVGESTTCAAYPAPQKRWKHSWGRAFPDYGRVGIMTSMFNLGPKSLDMSPPHIPGGYGSISGRMEVQNVMFANFRKRAVNLYSQAGNDPCQITDRAIMTNEESPDVTHPLHARSITWLRVDEDSKFLIHRPRSGWINEEDCVFMDCRGPLSVLLNDIDGTFTGLPAAPVGQPATYRVIFSEAEYQSSNAFGAIPPITLLTRHDGTRLTTADISIGRGIARMTANGECEKRVAWQAWVCNSEHNYRMLVIESMDLDTETRNLAPVVVLSTGHNGVQGSDYLLREEALGKDGNNDNRGGGYLDLLNSQMDHGWCMGYTCLKRLSTFYGIVAVPMEYTVYFTSTNPQTLRYHLLHADASEGIKVASWYSNPQKLTVAVGSGPVIEDLNWPNDTYRGVADPSYVDRYPTPTSASGTNAYFRLARTIHFTVKGPTHVELRTLPIIQVSLTLALGVEDFFDQQAQFVSRLAFVLNIPTSRLRIVNVVAGSVAVDFVVYPNTTNIVSDPVANNTAGSGSNNTAPVPAANSISVVFAELVSVQETLITMALSGALQDSLNVGIEALAVVPPVAPAVAPAPNSTTQESALPDANGQTRSAPTLSFGRGEFRFTSANLSVAEDAGTLELTVLRANGTFGNENVTVTLTAEGLEAVAGADFADFEETLVFQRGEDRKVVSIPILNDGAFENPNERFRLALSNPTGGTSLGVVPVAIVTITNDGDWAGLQGALPQLQLDEAGCLPFEAASLSVEVTRQGSAEGPADFVLRIVEVAPDVLDTEGGDVEELPAMDGEDFDGALETAVHFDDGETVVVVTIVRGGAGTAHPDARRVGAAVRAESGVNIDVSGLSVPLCFAAQLGDEVGGGATPSAEEDDTPLIIGIAVGCGVAVIAVAAGVAVWWMRGSHASTPAKLNAKTVMYKPSPPEAATQPAAQGAAHHYTNPMKADEAGSTRSTFQPRHAGRAV